jgi:glucose/arabinose dehydrogenase
MRRTAGHWVAHAATSVLAVSIMVAAAGVHPAAAGAGIVVKKVKGGLHDPAAFTFSRKGIIYYLERETGEVRVLNPKTNNDRLFFQVPGVVGTSGDERGALGVALDPNWPHTPYVYVYATRSAKGKLRNQVTRIKAKDNHGVSFTTLVSTPASASPYHNGGRILFGPDGKLYAIVGDGHNSANAQDRTKNLRGKILRMNRDGSVPKTNPFPKSLIWSYGHRNSFGFAFDSQTNKLWETENGPECNDEINLISQGSNFAWGSSENCSGSSPDDTNNSGPDPKRFPKAWFVSTIGITGDAFCTGCGLSGVEGDLFFGDVNTGKLRRFNLNPARDDFSGGAVDVLQTPRNAIYSMETGPDGTIYFSDDDAIYKLMSG